MTQWGNNGPYPPRPRGGVASPQDYQTPGAGNSYYPNGQPNYGPYQGQGAPAAGWPFGDQPVKAELNPPDWQQHAANQRAQWARLPLYYPNPLVPNAPGLVTIIRDYPKSFSTAGTGDALITLNTARAFSVRFDCTGILYGFSAAAYRTDGSGWPVGSKPIDWFDYHIKYAQGDEIQNDTGILSAFAGSGENPRWFVGNAHKINNGTVLSGTITPRLANVAVTLNYWICEVRGPTNVMPAGG